MKRAPANKLIFTYLRSSTDENMAVDGSSTAVTFDYTCPAGKRALIHRINFFIVDNAMQYGRFGGLTAGLTNGLLIKAHDADDAVLLDFLNGETIQTNEDFTTLSGVDAIIEPTAGDDYLPIRWTIAKSGAELHLQPGQYIRLTVQDNLTGLTKFEAMVQGYLEDF